MRSVTANTRADGEKFLALAASIPIQVTTVAFGLSEERVALRASAHDQVDGAAVIHAGR